MCVCVCVCVRACVRASYSGKTYIKLTSSAKEHLLVKPQKGREEAGRSRRMITFGSGPVQTVSLLGEGKSNIATPARDAGGNEWQCCGCCSTLPRPVGKGGQVPGIGVAYVGKLIHVASHPLTTGRGPSLPPTRCCRPLRPHKAPPAGHNRSPLCCLL